MKTIYKQCILEIIQAYCTEKEWKLIEKKLNKNLRYMLVTDFPRIQIMLRSNTPLGMLRKLEVIPQNSRDEFADNIIWRFEHNSTFKHRIVKKYNL